jgi:hypothetical protein
MAAFTALCHPFTNSFLFSSFIDGKIPYHLPLFLDLLNIFPITNARPAK